MSALRVPTGRLDTELRLAGVRDDDGTAHVEVRLMHRGVSDVSLAGYHDAAPPVRIPAAYFDVFVERARRALDSLREGTAA